MDVKSTVKGNILEAEVTVQRRQSGFLKLTSTEILINGAVVFQLMLMQNDTHDGHTRSIAEFSMVFLKFRRCQDAVDGFTYTIKFTSKELDIQDKRFTSNDDAWHLLYENHKTELTDFNLVVHMEVLPSVSSFAGLYDDTELTDFELRGEDGSVHVHRAALAAGSQCQWRGTNEGHVDVPGTSSATLQHLKNYVYLHSLPDAGLEQLLLLAAHYEMLDLEQQCVDKLVRSVTAENACDMIEFAVKHKVTRLLLAVLECVQSGLVSIIDMRKCFAESSNDKLESNWAHLPFPQGVSIEHVK